MKKISFAAVLMFASLIVAAQKKDPVTKKDTPASTSSSFMMNSQLLTFSQMDQRKIYHWGNGQRSTPTGRQAGEVTPKYVRVMGDSAVVVWNPIRKPDWAKNKSPW